MTAYEKLTSLAAEIPVGDVIGRSVGRLESREKANGAAIYTDDIQRPGMLHAALLMSPYAHARIKSYDTRAARQLAGVKAVLTAEDLPNCYYGMFIKDQTPLARGKVRYIGDPVAAVAAVDIDTARAALRLIEVEYEELEPVFDPRAALEPGAPVLHEDRANYVSMFELPKEPNGCCYTFYQEGDPAAAFAACDVVVEGEYTVPAQYHMYMEPSTTVAESDSTGKVTLWSSLQGVARVQKLVADALGMPMSKLRVIAPRVGGGFGGKCELTNQPIVVALALATSRPVKLTYSREEDMSMMKSRHAGTIRMKTGARRDGTLVARTAEIILDGGAYADESPEVGPVAAYFARGPYRIEHTQVAATVAYTNRLRASAFRGFGNPQATFASEAQIDEVAARLGIDPFDLRLKNALRQGDPWLGGKTIENANLVDVLQAARTASDWDRRRAAPRAPGKRRGLGMAAMAHISAMLSAAASVRLNEDGSLTVNTGAVDIGQGCDTALAQIVAGTLGVALEKINYASPDSDFSPYNYQTAASRNTYMVGKAVAEASLRVREQIIDNAAEMLECAPEDLALRPGGQIGIKGQPDAVLPFAAVAARALFAGSGPITGAHDWRYPGEQLDPKRTLARGFALVPDGVGIFTFGVHVAEVEVDELTGLTEVKSFWAAHDVGRALNPMFVDGQIHGAVVQGLGYALTEELRWDDGRLVNPSMMDYKIPGMADMPHAIHTVVLEQPERTAPFGAKGIGEIGIVGPAPALVNAIRHATGASVNEIPATPERVLQALAARAISAE